MSSSLAEWWHSYHRLQLCSLLAEGTTAHLEHLIKALTSFDSILLELLNGGLLHGVLDLLPSSANCSNLGVL